jgi:hypothetical protein
MPLICHAYDDFQQQHLNSENDEALGYASSECG